VRGLHDRIALVHHLRRRSLPLGCLPRAYVTSVSITVRRTATTARQPTCGKLFSRLRRAEIGTHHKIAGPYLQLTRLKWTGAKITAASATANSTARSEGRAGAPGYPKIGKVLQRKGER